MNKKVIAGVTFAVIMGLFTIVVLTAYFRTGCPELALIAFLLFASVVLGICHAIENSKAADYLSELFGKEGEDHE